MFDRIVSPSFEYLPIVIAKPVDHTLIRISFVFYIKKKYGFWKCSLSRFSSKCSPRQGSVFWIRLGRTTVLTWYFLMPNEENYFLSSYTRSTSCIPTLSLPISTFIFNELKGERKKNGKRTREFVCDLTKRKILLLDSPPPPFTRHLL